MRIQQNINDLQTVTPQLIASMTVLQCGAQELADYLEEMSYENPLMELELKPPEQDRAFPNKLFWLKSNDCQNRSYYADTAREGMEQYLHQERAARLSDLVKEQILMAPAGRTLRRAMEMVADLLDRRGLYTGSAQELAALVPCSPALAAEALERVRQMEPPGVAAESVKEVLLRQLERMEPRKPLAERLVREHYEHLATWSEGRLSKEMAVSQSAIRAAKDVLGQLAPYPGNGFAGEEDIQYITPDISIFDGEAGLTVTAENPYIPNIRINGAYLRMLQTEQDPEVQKYLRGKLSQLEQVIRNVDRRKSTVLRCGEVIARRQAAFFRGGSMGKLTLRDVAEELELHESTVSRAVKNKYVQCGRGVFPMTAFFSRDVGQNVGLSRSYVQEVLQRIIAQEDPLRPLSDEKLSGALRKHHITLSRRAVAKYRMELGILPASARKGHTSK